jgi:hypothetical protein
VSQDVESLGSGPNQLTAVCTEVDGNFIQGCPFGGTTTNTFYSSTLGLRVVAGLSTGSHTVQDFFFTTANALLGYYSFTYRVYATG